MYRSYRLLKIVTTYYYVVHTNWEIKHHCDVFFFAFLVVTDISGAFATRDAVLVFEKVLPDKWQVQNLCNGS